MEPGGESHKARCENLRGKQLSRSTKYVGRIKNPVRSNGNSYEIRWSRYCAHRCKTRTHNCGDWGLGGRARVTRNDSWRADVRVTWSSWADGGKAVSSQTGWQHQFFWSDLFSPEETTKKFCLLVVCLLFYMVGAEIKLLRIKPHLRLADNTSFYQMTQITQTIIFWALYVCYCNVLKAVGSTHWVQFEPRPSLD